MRILRYFNLHYSTLNRCLLNLKRLNNTRFHNGGHYWHKYKNEVAPKALRIKNYSDYFLMFTDIKNIQVNLSDTLYGLNQKTVSIEKWISFLRDVSTNDRRNSHTRIGGS